MTLGVLVVCTGNICRSPLAERLLIARAGGLDVAVTSAGTRAVRRSPMDDDAAVVLREFGGNPDGHVGRQLKAAMVAEAGLVLTATEEHRSVVIRETPSAMRRTFTLREFVRLGETVPQTEYGTAGIVAAVAAQRGTHPPVGPGGNDVADPYRMPLAVMRDCGAQLDDLITRTVRILGG